MSMQWEKMPFILYSGLNQAITSQSQREKEREKERERGGEGEISAVFSLVPGNERQKAFDHGPRQ
jgi:hypothetical protein